VLRFATDVPRNLRRHRVVEVIELLGLSHRGRGEGPKVAKGLCVAKTEVALAVSAVAEPCAQRAVCRL
jgi:hypothetical protein